MNKYHDYTSKDLFPLSSLWAQNVGSTWLWRKMLELTWISNVDLTLCAQKEAYLFNTDEPSLLLFVVILDLHIHFYDKCSHLINLNLLVPYGTTLELVLGFIVTWIY
jgi:hypothetical protein